MKHLSTFDNLTMSNSAKQLFLLKELVEQQARIADSLEIISKKLK